MSVTTSELSRRTSVSSLRHRAPDQDQATDASCRNHPEWLARVGDRGRDLAREDAGFHVDFPVGAVEAGEPQGLADDLRWARNVLGARRVRPCCLAEHLRQISAARRPCLEPDSAAAVRPAVQADIDASGDVDDEQAAAEPTAQPELRQCVRSLLLGHRHAATSVALEHMQHGVSATDVAVDLIEPAPLEVSGAIVRARPKLAARIGAAATAASARAAVALAASIFPS